MSNPDLNGGEDHSNHSNDDPDAAQPRGCRCNPLGLLCLL